MKTVTATEVKNRFGTYLREVIAGPIFIEKTHNTIAVMLSLEEYKRLKKFEDAYWLNKAYEDEKEGYLSETESREFLKEAMSDEA